MEVVVNDTNIFIDLYTIGMLDEFFNLPINVHTVDFVINEITNHKQLDAINNYIENNKLMVHSFNAQELIDVIELHNSVSGNLSVTDSAVWYCAQRNNYTLLTGDRQLRDRASESKVLVKGIIYIFDLLVEHNLITANLASEKILELMMYNPRLPKSIIKERIETWEKI